MTVRDYIGVLRQRILVVLMTVFLTTAAAVLLQLQSKPTYQAKSRLLVVPLSLTGAGEELSTKYHFDRGTATEAEILKSSEVSKRVIAKLGLDRGPYTYGPEELIKDITVVPVQSTDVLEVTFNAPDPRLAAAVANAFPEEYIRFKRAQAVANAKEGVENLSKEMGVISQRLNEVDLMLQKTSPESARGDVLRTQRNQLGSQLAVLEINRSKLVDESSLTQRGVGEIIEFAVAPSTRSNSDLARTAVLGLIIGIPLALGFALLLEALTDTIKTKEEAERIVGVEALGVIPLSPEWRSSRPYVVTKEAPYSAAAEAFRTLRINLDSKNIVGEGRHILFTSAQAGEGKTITSANLGVAFAEAGRSALVVSTDLRRPRLHKFFNMEVGPGLTDLINGDTEPADAVVETSPHLYIMPSGTRVERPDQLLSRSDIGDVLRDVSVVRAGKISKPRNDENGTSVKHQNGHQNGRSKSSKKPTVYSQPDVVLLDSPAVLGAAEVSSLARSVDGVVLVLQAGVSRREAVARAAEQIRRAGGSIIGVVLVGVKLDNDYSVYPPIEEVTDSSDSTWSRVVGAIRQ